MRNDEAMIRLEVLESECIYNHTKGVNPFSDYCSAEFKKCCKKYKKGKRCKKCPKR